MSKYANSFWSPDYISGIDRLSRQSVLSVGQLHELRRFVFSYMKHFHANGEYLANMADASYPIDSSFRNSRGQKTDRKISGYRHVSRSNYRPEEDTDLDMDYVFRQFVDRTRQDSRVYQKTASEIDSEVLDKVTSFIKHHEPQVKQHLSDMDDLFDEYKHAYESVETIKQEYTAITRLGEFSIHKEVKEDSGVEELSEDLQEESFPTDLEDLDDSFGSILPISIAGATLFSDQASFSRFVCNLIRSVPVTRRKIPLPGYRNEIFCSEHLCDAIRREKPKTFNPTRSNLEKLGQILLDSKVIVGTGFFAKKFSSEGMWFEWSDPAVSLLEKKPAKNPGVSNMAKLDETWSHVTSNTSKRFTGVLKSVQNTLSKPRFSEDDLLDSEDHYNEAYSELQKQKHLLEMKIISACQGLEQFEKLKIQLVFKSLSDLSRILADVNSRFSQELEAFSHRFTSEFNTEENHLLEFNKGLATFGSGVYFPSLLAPDHSGRHLKTSQLNTNFQNIRLEFNLFKDIPLQAKVCDKISGLPLGVHSIPAFLFEGLKMLETHSKSELCKAWKMPLNYQQYWLIKDDILSEIQEIEPEDVKNKHSPELALLDLAISHLQKKDVFRHVNFIKNWLLEISDSVIPSTVHDSLIANYKITRTEENAENVRMAETTRILGSIPRNNLSSLIYILEHIARTFNIDILEGYASDETEKSIPKMGAKELHNLATELNSLDTIGAIPFLHLIMRPSVVKHASGYRPPMDQYNLLLRDLLFLDTRSTLFQALIDSENAYIRRQEQQKQNLGIQRHRATSGSGSGATSGSGSGSASGSGSGSASGPASGYASANPETRIEITVSEDHDKAPKTLPQSPTPVKNENFELRPFRTGATPRPSPSSSPVAAKAKLSEAKTSIFLAPVTLNPEK